MRKLFIALLLLAAPAFGRSTWTLDAGETSASARWPGGAGTLQVGGSFAGSPTVTFEWTAGPPVNAWIELDAANCTFTAAGRCNFVVGNGDLRLVVTGGTGAGIVTAVIGQPFQASIGPFFPPSISSDAAAPDASITIASTGDVSIPGSLSVNAGDTNEAGITFFNSTYGFGIDNSDLVIIVNTDTGLSIKEDTVAGATLARFNASNRLFTALFNIGAFPPATCAVGTIFIDTDETDDTNCTTTLDNALCLCLVANTWTEFVGV